MITKYLSIVKFWFLATALFYVTYTAIAKKLKFTASTVKKTIP